MRYRRNLFEAVERVQTNLNEKVDNRTLNREPKCTVFYDNGRSNKDQYFDQLNYCEALKQEFRL